MNPKVYLLQSIPFRAGSSFSRQYHSLDTFEYPRRDKIYFLFYNITFKGKAWLAKDETL